MEEYYFTQPRSDSTDRISPDLQTTVTARQRLESQEQENKSVQTEFASLPSESNIYKLIGPCLVKQEREEAVQSVNARLDFIGNEIKKVEGQIGEMQAESEKKKMEVSEYIHFAVVQLGLARWTLHLRWGNETRLTWEIDRYLNCKVRCSRASQREKRVRLKFSSQHAFHP